MQKGADRACRADLTDQINISNIDAQLERRGRNQCAQLTALQSLFRIQSLIARKAAVMRGDVVTSNSLRQMARGALGEPACIDEDQRRPVLTDQLGEPVIHLCPDLAGHHRFQWRWWKFDRQIAVSNVSGIDDRAIFRTDSDQKLGDFADRLLRGGQSDAHEIATGKRLQTLERQRQMCAAFVRRYCVDLVDDHGACGRQHLAAGLAGQQDVQGFGRGDDDVRWTPSHLLALALRCISGAHERANVDVGES